MKRIFFVAVILFNFTLLADAVKNPIEIEQSISVTENTEDISKPDGLDNGNDLQPKVSELSVLADLEPIRGEGKSNSLIIYAVMLISLVWLVIGAASLFPKDSHQDS